MSKGDGKLMNRLREGNIILEIWENPGQKNGKTIKLLTFVITRSYLDEVNQERKYTKSYGESDLLRIQKLIDKYFSIVQTQNNNGQEGAGIDDS